MPFVIFKFTNPGVQTRSVTYPSDALPTWQTISSSIAPFFEIALESFGITYLDHEGDEVTMSTNEELQQYYATIQGTDEASFTLRFGVIDLSRPNREALNDDNDSSTMSDSDAERLNQGLIASLIEEDVAMAEDRPPRGPENPEGATATGNAGANIQDDANNADNDDTTPGGHRRGHRSGSGRGRHGHGFPFWLAGHPPPPPPPHAHHHRGHHHHHPPPPPPPPHGPLPFGFPPIPPDFSHFDFLNSGQFPFGPEGSPFSHHHGPGSHRRHGHGSSGRGSRGCGSGTGPSAHSAFGRGAGRRGGHAHRPYSQVFVSRGAEGVHVFSGSPPAPANVTVINTVDSP